MRAAPCPRRVAPPLAARRCSPKIPFEACVLRALRVCSRPRNIRYCACGCVPEAAREDPLRAGAPATSWPARVAARSQSRFTAQTRDRVRVPAEARGAITGSSSSNAANTSVCARAQANGRLVEASGGEAILCVRRVRLFGSFATRITDVTVDRNFKFSSVYSTWLGFAQPPPGPPRQGLASGN